MTAAAMKLDYKSFIQRLEVTPYTERNRHHSDRLFQFTQSVIHVASCTSGNTLSAASGFRVEVDWPGTGGEVM